MGKLKGFLMAAAMAALLNVPAPVNACTLFAANGNVVDGGGTLVGKNRDAVPDNQFIQFNNKHQNAYYGLACGDPNGKSLMTAGVNDKGLVIIIAKTSSMDQKVRAAMGSRTSVRQALGQCSTVAEVLSHKEFFNGPDFVIIGDATEIARVEVGSDRKMSVDRVKNGSLAHTNHFLNDAFKGLDVKAGKGSHVRQERIEFLLENAAKPMTMETFKEFTADANDGPVQSLWRTGNENNRQETVFSFVVDLKPNKDFNIWLKYREKPSDRGNEKVVSLSRKEIFGK